MPTGANNVFININQHDTGSIIAYGLMSNSYFEALLKCNFMDLEHKLKDALDDKNYFIILEDEKDLFNSPNVEPEFLNKKIATELKKPLDPKIWIKRQAVNFKLDYSTHCDTVQV